MNYSNADLMKTENDPNTTLMNTEKLAALAQAWTARNPLELTPEERGRKSEVLAALEESKGDEL